MLGLWDPKDYDLDITDARSRDALQKYSSLSQAIGTSTAKLDIPYGQHPRQVLDVFPTPGSGATVLHFHGGYWVGGSKENNWFAAPVLNSLGATWILAEYRLCPDVTLNDVVDDAVAAFDHVLKMTWASGSSSRKVHLSGHSAGAHLAAMVAARRTEVASLTVASGIYDLAPLRSATPQDWLALSEGCARDLSPLYLEILSHCPVIIGWGQDETDGFKGQSRIFAARCFEQGFPVSTFEALGCEHFEIIGQIADEDSAMFKAMVSNF